MKIPPIPEEMALHLLNNAAAASQNLEGLCRLNIHLLSLIPTSVMNFQKAALMSELLGALAAGIFHK